MIKVLFFDDDPYVAFPLVNRLEEEFGWKENREITVVYETCQLLNEIYNDKVKYDLFVLDVVAPICPEVFTKEELDEMYFGYNAGLVISKRIRKLEKYNNVPILFLSARLLDIPESERGITCFLEKMALVEDISKAMKMLLRNN